MATLLNSLTYLFHGPPKRKPEDIFHSSDDVYESLTAHLLRDAGQESLDALETAFQANAEGADGGLHWTPSTLTRLLQAAPNRIPGGIEASNLLWRLLLAVVAFPFRADPSQTTINRQAFVRAFAFLRRGTSALGSPGYCILDPPSLQNRTQRVLSGRDSRRRGRADTARFLFQALATVPPTDPMAPAHEDSNVDAIDVMAACMDVEDEKHLFCARDFAAAVRQLPDTLALQKAGWRVRAADAVVIARLAESIRDARGEGGSGTQPGLEVALSDPDGEALALEEFVAALGPSEEDAGPRDDSIFVRTNVRERPGVYDLLSKYLLHVLASGAPQREGMVFGRKVPRENRAGRSSGNIATDDPGDGRELRDLPGRD